jgi:hypothetical protein
MTKIEGNEDAGLCWICQRYPIDTSPRSGTAHAQPLFINADLCAQCVGITQPYQGAWDKLSAYLHKNWKAIVTRQQFDAQSAGINAVAVQLHFVKALGSQLRAEQIAVDSGSLASALLAGKAHAEITLLLADTTAAPGQLVFHTRTPQVLRHGDDVLSAMWTCLVHPVAVKVCYIKTGAPVRAPEGHPWHPERQRKIVKLSPYEGDVQPLIARRDLRI